MGSMARSTRLVLAVLAAVVAAGLWMVLTYGIVIAFGHTFDFNQLSNGARTALTTGVLGAALAGGVAAAMVCFFLVAGDPDQTDPSETGQGA